MKKIALIFGFMGLFNSSVAISLTQKQLWGTFVEDVKLLAKAIRPCQQLTKEEKKTFLKSLYRISIIGGLVSFGGFISYIIVRNSGLPEMAATGCMETKKDH